MAKPSGGRYEYCPSCKKKGFYTPQPLPGGVTDSSKVCKYCGHLDIKVKTPIKDVHTEHCCLKHGCKYGDVGDHRCTVMSEALKQSFPCEDCDRDAERFEELKEYLKKHLSISFNEWRDYYSHGLRVTVTLDGEEIASDSVSLPEDHYRS